MRTSMDVLLRREQTIMETLNERKRLSVDEIAEMFAVTPSTVRRMLASMEQRGMVTRTLSGVVSAPDWSAEYDTRTKRFANLAEKKAIAAAALSYIHERDIILMGNGTTVLELAKQLKHRTNLIVVTTSIPVAMELYESPGLEVQIIGGLVRSYTGTIIGPQAQRALAEIHFDKAFIGADSLSITNGITTPYLNELEMDKITIENSKESYVLADHTKFDKVTLAHLANLEAVDYIITDCENKSQCAAQLKKQARPQIIFAPFT